MTHWNRLASESDRQEAGEIEAMEQWAPGLVFVCLDAGGVYPYVGPSGHCTAAGGLGRIEAALQSGAPLAQTGSQR